MTPSSTKRLPAPAFRSAQTRAGEESAGLRRELRAARRRDRTGFLLQLLLSAILLTASLAAIACVVIER